MSYDPLPQTPMANLTPQYTHEDDDLFLHNSSSTLDLALNGSENLSSSYNIHKTHSGLHPHHLSHAISNTPSHFSSASPESRSWLSSFRTFYTANESLLRVALSQLFGALMNVTTRLLELEGDGMHPFQILFARQGLTMLFCTVWMWWKGTEGFPFGEKGVRALLVARASCGFWGIFGMYYSLQYLAVADATVITFLAPSVASYGCYMLLKEPFPRAAQYASFVALLGVILIAQPFSSTSSPAVASSTSNNTTMNDSGAAAAGTEIGEGEIIARHRLLAVFFALLGVLGAAGAFTSIRFIGTRAHPLTSVNYFSAFCFLISSFVLLFSGPLSHLPYLQSIPVVEFVLPSSATQWAELLFLSVCGLVMQYLLTTGLGGKAGGKGEKATKGGGARATNMVYSQILFSLALDRVIWGVVPGGWSLVGGGLVLGSAVFVGLTKDGVKSKNELNENGGVEHRGTGDEEMAMLSSESEIGGELDGGERRGSAGSVT